MAANSPKELLSTKHWVSPASHNAVDIATVDSEIDTIGWRYALVLVHCGTLAAAWTIQVEAAAATGGTFADITGAVFAIAATDDDTTQIGVIDLQGGAVNLNRFLQLNGTGAAGANLLGVTVILCVAKDTAEYIAYGSGGADELTFEV